MNSSRYEFEDEDNDSDSLIAGGGGGKKSMELLTCTVGPSSKKTHAEWHVESPEDLIVILGQMALCSE